MSDTHKRSKKESQAAPRERGGIQSLERAAAILETVSRSRDGIGLADISARNGLHTSTAFHLVRTLVTLGFLVQLPDSKRYRIGSRIFGLAAGALDETMLLTLATPILERLSAETGEAAHLAIRSKQDIIVSARTEASGLLQLGGRTGATRPAHATAIGKTLLAAMPPDEFDRLLVDLPMPGFTARTLTDPEALRCEIDEARRKGIAYDNCELDEDVRCAAVPVHDFAGRGIAAMGISGPVWRLSSKTMAKKTRKLLEAAAELSALIGHEAVSGGVTGDRERRSAKDAANAFPG